MHEYERSDLGTRTLALTAQFALSAAPVLVAAAALVRRVRHADLMHLLTELFGLHGTALVYSAAIAGLAAAAAGTFVSSRSSRTGPSAQQAAAASDVCPVPCTVPPHTLSAHHEAEPAKVPT